MVERNLRGLDQNKKLILVFLGAVVLGTGVVLNLNQIITLIQEKSSPLANFVIPVTTRIQEGISQLPEQYRGFLLGTVPLGLVSLGYTWWRNRQENELAKKSLEKIQTQNAENLASRTEIQTLKTQLAQYQAQPNQSSMLQGLQGQLGDLQTSLQESQKIVTQQSQELNTLRNVANVDYVRKLQEALRANNIPLPAYDGNTITVVK